MYDITPSLPNIENWEWRFEKGIYIPNWTELQKLAVVRELVKCGCKPEKDTLVDVNVYSGLMCTKLCKCNGECETNS